MDLFWKNYTSELWTKKKKNKIASCPKPTYENHFVDKQIFHLQ